MTLFWVICAVLLVVALPFVVLPLWRNRANKNDVLRDAANLEILRDQSAELDADLHNRLLTQEAYEQGKRELQARLLEEVNTTGQPVGQRNPAKVLALALAVLLPLFSVPLYLKTGNTNAILFAGSSGNVSPDIALQELEKKVAKQPEDPNNLVMLARSYGSMGRFSDAVRAYQKLVELVPEEAQAWVEYADVYAMNNGQSLLGEPTKFLDKALALDGSNITALQLSGSAAMERRDYAAAIQRWTKVTDLLPPDNPELPRIWSGIQQARNFLASQQGGKEKLAQLPAGKLPKNIADSMASTITGKVSLSPALADKVAPENTVFIFARDAAGSKMLLAVLRKQVKDLPFQFTLDDSMAMLQQAKLSGFSKVTVVARVSKSGNPVGEPGDLQGTTGIIKPGAKGVNIAIDTVIQ